MCRATQAERWCVCVLCVICRDVCKVVKDLSEEERALWRGSSAYHAFTAKPTALSSATNAASAANAEAKEGAKQRLEEQWLAKLGDHLKMLIEVLLTGTA